MTASGWWAPAWCALAAALLCAPTPSGTPARVRTLRDAGRLAAVEVPRRSSPVRWRPASTGWSWQSTTAAVVVVAVGVAAWRGVALGVAAGALAGAMARVGWCTVRRRLDARLRQRILEAVRLMAAEVEAGSSPAAALAAAAGVVPDWAASLQVASVAAQRGDDLERVLAAAARAGPAVGRTEIRAVAQAWRVSARTGAPLVDVLGRLAGDLAAAQQQRRAVAAALAGPRSSMALLAGLPAVGLGLGLALGARPFAVLFGSSAGRLLCCAGVVLEAIGVLWTERLTTRAERS